MNIPQWPADDKPREKLLQHGAAHLSNAELLAILIQCGTQKHNAVDLARQLLHQHRDLNGVFNASLQELNTTHGIGPAKYASIQAAFELAKRQFHPPRNETYITNSDEALRYFKDRLHDKQQETFACLFLGYRHQILGFEAMTKGTINQTNIHSREVARSALKHNASSIIIGHNHPTGHAKPSQADIRATQQLINDLKPLCIYVVDHIIISDKESLSFLDKGLMSSP